MGMQVGGAKGGPKSDINVTPLVDIVLVLLIIFLVITPIKMRFINIEVPRKLDDKTEVSMDSRQLVVVVRGDSTVKLSDGREEQVLDSIYKLSAAIRPILEAKRTEKVVFVDFEDPVPYGDAVVTMDIIKGAGAEKVALKLREDDKPQP